MTTRPDAIVVGAGIVGAACAYYLSRQGMRVTLLDAAFAGGGTTAAGMGHIVVMDDSEAQFALTGWSQRLLDELLPQLPPSAEFERCGTLWVAENDAQLQAAREKATFYRDRGVRADLLEAGELAEAEPMLRPGLAGGLRVPGDGVLYPPVVARWLADEAVANGAVMFEGTRVEAIHARAVATSAGRFEADVIVNAAGAAAACSPPSSRSSRGRGTLPSPNAFPGPTDTRSSSSATCRARTP